MIKNHKFPTFDFDKWLTAFVCLLTHWKLPMNEFEEMLGKQLDLLEESKENFYAQVHTEDLEFGEEDFCDEYMTYLLKFNEFMRDLIVFTSPYKLEDLCNIAIEWIDEIDEMTEKDAYVFAFNLLSLFNYLNIKVDSNDFSIPEGYLQPLPKSIQG